MFISGYYKVEIGDYAQRHFIKDFAKKYAGAWKITLDSIYQSLYRIDIFLQTTKAEIISSNEYGDLIKCEFSIAGSNVSAHASGNRYIVYRDKKIKKNTILLLYSKNNIKIKKSETQRRKQEIKNNYPFIREGFSSL